MTTWQRYYARNREKIKARQRAWSSRNREYYRSYSKAYAQRNRNRINERKRINYQSAKSKATRRSWEQKNRDKKRAWDKGYRERHPEKVALNYVKRRTRTRNAVRGCQKRVRSIYLRCRELRKWFDVCVDHIIPLAFGGAHSANNLQIIYQFENRKKRANPFFQPSVIFL